MRKRDTERERGRKIDEDMQRSDFNLRTAPNHHTDVAKVAECSTYRAGKPLSGLDRLHRKGIELRYPRCPSRSCRSSPSVLLSASLDIFGGILWRWRGSGNGSEEEGLRE